MRGRAGSGSDRRGAGARPLPRRTVVMKIVVAQLNLTVRAFERNLGRMELALAEARAKGADLIVYPEQAIPGCPARYFCFLPAFVERNLRALEGLARQTRGEGPGVVVGFIDRAGGP